MTRDDPERERSRPATAEPSAREPVPVETALDAGRILYAQGRVRAAREPLERALLPLPDGADDERLLSGLAGFVAALQHARSGNASTARGLAADARESLDAVPARHRGVAVDDLCESLATLAAMAAAPEAVAEDSRPDLAPDAADPLAEPELETVLIAVESLAEVVDGVAPDVVADAVRYAREERGTGRTRYAELLTTFLAAPEQRAPVYARLSDRVERERAKEDDVSGLF